MVSKAQRQSEGGRKGALAGHAKRTKEERIAKARHALACRRAKERARAGYVMEAVQDQDVYISEEEFDALE